VIYKTIKEAEMEKNLSKNETINRCLNNSFKSLVDIIRTPAYGVAMTIVSLASLVIGLASPKSLYTFRETIGKMIKALNRTEELCWHDLFACFQPLKNLTKMNKPTTSEHSDTQYQPDMTDCERRLIHFARNNIRFRRENYNFFNNPFGKLNPNTHFISPSYKDVEKVKQGSDNLNLT
jgi:hypothetical protein